MYDSPRTIDIRGEDVPVMLEEHALKIGIDDRDVYKRQRRVCYDYTGVGIGMGDVLVKEFKRWHPEGHEFGPVSYTHLYEFL